MINQFSTNIQGTRRGLPAERMMAEVKEELNSPCLVVMDRNLKDYDSFRVNVDLPFTNTNNVREKSNKCNQCNYASSLKSSLKRHFKTHTGEKSIKCNQCCHQMVCILLRTPFEDTFENTQWRKVKQMQSM